MKRYLVETKPHRGNPGAQRIYKFPNGWGASVVPEYKLSTSNVWSDVVGETNINITFLPWSYNGNTNNDVDLRLVVTDSDGGVTHPDCTYTTNTLTLNPNYVNVPC